VFLLRFGSNHPSSGTLVHKDIVVVVDIYRD